MLKWVSIALVLCAVEARSTGLWLDGVEQLATSSSITTNEVSGTNVVEAWRGGLLYYFPFENDVHKSSDYSSNRLVDFIGNYKWTNANPAGPVGGYGVTNGTTFQLYVTATTFSANFSLAMWIRTANHSFPVGLFALWTNDAGIMRPSIDYFVGAPGGGNTNAKPTLQISNGSAIEPSTNMVDNAFHHHAITFQTNVWRLYIDGQQLGVMTAAWSAVAGTTNEYGDAAPSFDEITAWNRTLSSNEVFALYNGGSGTSLWVDTISSITTNVGAGGSGITLNGIVPLSSNRHTWANGVRLP